MASVTGAADINKRLRREVKKINGDVAQVVKLMAFESLSRSKAQTPVDTGNLRSGQYAAQADSAGHTWEIGAIADYAPFVHENLEANHPTGNAKFMENAINKVFSRSNATARFRRVLKR